MFDGRGICLQELIYFRMINWLALVVFGCDSVYSYGCDPMPLHPKFPLIQGSE